MSYEISLPVKPKTIKQKPQIPGTGTTKVEPCKELETLKEKLFNEQGPSQKVESIKNALASGCYQMDSVRIAERLLETSIGENLFRKT